MILSHTPLKMFDWLHNKHVLVSGQGSAKEILQEYPFTIYLGHVAEVSVSWKINNVVHLSKNRICFHGSIADQCSTFALTGKKKKLKYLGYETPMMCQIHTKVEHIYISGVEEEGRVRAHLDKYITLLYFSMKPLATVVQRVNSAIR